MYVCMYVCMYLARGRNVLFLIMFQLIRWIRCQNLPPPSTVTINVTFLLAVLLPDVLSLEG